MRTAAALGILWILTGCTLVGSPGPPGSRPDPPGSPTAEGKPVSSEVVGGNLPAGSGSAHIPSRVVETAFEAVGSPYLWGGTGDNGFDCSGLIQYAYGEYGIDLPRVSGDQLMRGEAVERRIETLEPGDILGFSAVVGGEAAHVGLYVGDGRFIHSSSSGVRVSDLREPYWQQHFVAARRIVQ